MLAPEAITAQAMAPAEEPANGVVSYVNIKKTIRILKIHRKWMILYIILEYFPQNRVSI